MLTDFQSLPRRVQVALLLSLDRQGERPAGWDDLTPALDEVEQAGAFFRRHPTLAPAEVEAMRWSALTGDLTRKESDW